MILQKAINQIDDKCQLIQDYPIENTGKKRFLFRTEKDENQVMKILEVLVQSQNLSISEFKISKPDLEDIFLKATKYNWEVQDLLGRKKNKDVR